MSRGIVSCGGLVASIVSSDTVLLNGKTMALAEFINMAEERVLVVIDNQLTTKAMLDEYKKYAVSVRIPLRYTLWRSQKHLAVLGCVLANKPLPFPDNQKILDGAGEIIMALEEELEENQKTSLRPISEVLQEYAVRAGAFYEACMLEVELPEQAVAKKQRVEE
jgi:hypothetical protein